MAAFSANIVSAQQLQRLSESIPRLFGFLSAQGAVTTNANLTVNVAAIAANSYIINGSVIATAYAGGTVTAGAAHASLSRIDTIVISNAGAVSIVAGTAAADPVPPDINTTTQLEVAQLLLGPGVTSFVAGNITQRQQRVSDPFNDSLRASFRIGRRKVAEFLAQGGNAGYDPTDGVTMPVSGSGFFMDPYSGGTVQVTWTLSVTSGEPIAHMSVAAFTVPTGICSGHYGAGTGAPTDVAVLSPAKSPRMLVRWTPSASSANCTTAMAGFFATRSNTANGAYLRANDTGNLYFVTRQGGAETATDLGVRPTTPTSYEIETADGGTTWICRNGAGTVLATHTTNVPTAATALMYGCFMTRAGGTITQDISYCLVEGTF